MVQRIQLLSLQLLALVLHHRWQVAESAGLRGNGELWRTNLVEHRSAGILLASPPSIEVPKHVNKDHTPPLVCDINAVSTLDSH